MPRYIAVTPIKTAGGTVAIGDPVTLSETDAEELRRFGAVGEPVSGEDAAGKDEDRGGDETAGGGAAPDPDVADILAVLPGLGADDFTKAGTPKVKAIEAKLGRDVTQEQVQAAWNLHAAGTGAPSAG